MDFISLSQRDLYIFFILPLLTWSSRYNCLFVSVICFILWFFQLLLLLWIKNVMWVPEIMENQWSSEVASCKDSRMLYRERWNTSSRESHRALLCHQLASYSSALPLFCTGAFTSLTCPAQHFPLLCTITSGVYERFCPGAPCSDTLLVFLALFSPGQFHFCLQDRVWLSSFFSVFISTGQHLTNQGQQTCTMWAHVSVSLWMFNIHPSRWEYRILKMLVQALKSGQAYRISLHLEMPDSPTNQELGMFMIKTTCFTANGGQVVSSAHSVSVRFIQLLCGRVWLSSPQHC